MTVDVNETQVLSIKDKVVNGVGFAVYCRAAANNTDIDGSDVDFSYILVKGTLKRGGKNFTLFQDTLEVLSALSSFYDSSWTYTSIAGQTAKKEVVAKATSVDEEIIIPLKLTFGNIDLHDGDSLEIEVTNKSGAYTADISTSESYILVTPLETNGVEWETPYILSKSISASEQRFSHSLGNHISQVLFLNTDKTDILDASGVLDNVSFTSKETSFNDVYYELLLKRALMFESTTEEDKRYQSFMLYDGEPVNGASLDLQLTSSNVNGGKNFIVARGAYTDERLIKRAMARQAMQDLKSDQKYNLKTGSQIADEAEQITKILQATNA